MFLMVVLVLKTIIIIYVDTNKCTGEKQMLNFTTKKNYSGSNIDLLQGLGQEFCTFNQAVTYYKLTGKELKGAKSCARLIKIVEREVFDKISKKKTKKLVPIYFNVFEKNHLISVLSENGIQV